MRAVKAKILRGKLGFHPGKEREYDTGKPSQKIHMDVQGKPQLHVVTGTIKCTGARRSYQAVKRNKTLTTAVLRAGMVGGL
jgi:hypothetical protein